MLSEERGVKGSSRETAVRITGSNTVLHGTRERRVGKSEPEHYRAIQNGIRFRAMAALGSVEYQKIWYLVFYIRTLLRSVSQSSP